MESYTGFGMERARMLVDQDTIKVAAPGAKAGDTVKSPCYLPGYEFGFNEFKMTGAGDAAACRALVETVLNRERISCENAAWVEEENAALVEESGKGAHEPCLGAAANGPGADRIASGSLQFIAVSGFVFVSDF